MDILDRIVEAVAQKLIALKLEENKYSYSETPDTGNKDAGKKSGSSNPGNKEARTRDTSQFHQDGFVPPEGAKQFSSKEAGASGNQRGRFRRGGDLASGTGADPHNRGARGKPVRPLSKEGPGGGQEETKSKVATRKK